MQAFCFFQNIQRKRRLHKKSFTALCGFILIRIPASAEMIIVLLQRKNGQLAMNIIDLTYPLENGMPLFPGTRVPRFEQLHTVAADGWAEKSLTITSHIGTHMDAPAHILAGAKTLDQLPVDHFTGPAAMIDIPEGTSQISQNLLEQFRVQLEAAEFIVLRSGWGKFWGMEKYLSDFPVLEQPAATYLAGMNLKGIAIDMISVDPVKSTNLPVHHILLGAGMVIVENLAYLDKIVVSRFDFTALPLSHRDADGSPVRAIARY
jgi:arylformamidase